MTLEKLNFHLLTTLGLSHDSAEIVMDRITELERERDELAAWKESALLVESRWDCQKVGKLLGMTLGHDIRPNIEPKIRALIEDGSQLRQAIGLLTCLHPSMVMMPDDPLGMAQAIARHVKAERHQVETKLSDALVENAHLKEAMAAGDCKDSAADNEILRAELRRLIVDECVSRSDAEKIAEALRAIE